jgi:hypothetical protein
MAQHSHFHLPRDSAPRTDPCSRRKQRFRCNLPVEEHYLEAEEKGLDCILSDWVEEEEGERIDRQVQRIGAVLHIDWAFHRVVEGTQCWAGSSPAHRRSLQALRPEEREQVGLDRKHLRMDHVLHFPQRLSQVRKNESIGGVWVVQPTSAGLFLFLALFSLQLCLGGRSGTKSCCSIASSAAASVFTMTTASPFIRFRA